MQINELGKNIEDELESPPALRQFGSGWFCGVAAMVASVAGLFLVISLRFPAFLTVPPLRVYYNTHWFTVGLHVLLIAAYSLAILNLVLRENKVLGFTAVTVTLLATILGGPPVETTSQAAGGVFVGLDWFVLRIIFTGLIFIPLERIFGQRKDQPIFHGEWREDLLYFFVSSVFIQGLVYLSHLPAAALVAITPWTAFRAWVGGQPAILQLIEIMIVTDLFVFAVHYTFHRVPFLWNIHAIHHSAQYMDWMSGGRIHIVELLILRSSSVIPAVFLGFSPVAMQMYLLVIFVHSTVVHANVRWNLDHLVWFLATPRFHQWHHAIDQEGIDVNFATHFPVLDMIFGTYYCPPGKWPSGYGIENHPVPKGYWRQFWYPFVKRQATAPPPQENAAT